MKIWKLSKSGFEFSIFSTCAIFSTWGEVYSDPLDASKDMFEQYTTRFNLNNKDVMIAEYHPAKSANLVLKDGRRWTWTIDMFEVT